MCVSFRCRGRGIAPHFKKDWNDISNCHYFHRSKCFPSCLFLFFTIENYEPFREKVEWRDLCIETLHMVLIYFIHWTNTSNKPYTNHTNRSKETRWHTPPTSIMIEAKENLVHRTQPSHARQLELERVPHLQITSTMFHWPIFMV
jgi:hypothetical protein